MTHAQKVEAASVRRDIELARPGKWRLASGELDVTPKMLDDAARFANREGARPGYLKIGHTDTRFMAADGEPALGWLHNIRLEEDDEGHVLKGDLHDVPDWLAEAMPRHWPDRSIEGYADYEHDGQRYGLVVDGLALLGVTPPGMSSIKSLRDLPQALGLPVAASNGTRIVASFGDVQTPAPEAGPPPTINKGVGMADPIEIREALGLGPDAADEEVRTAFAEAFPSPPDQGRDQRVAAAASRNGVITIDAAQLQQFQEGMVRASALADQMEKSNRDACITEAIKVGKFPPARRAHYEKAWNADPEGTKELIASLSAGLVPVTAMGYAGDGTDLDLDYRALYGSPDRKAG